LKASDSGRAIFVSSAAAQYCKPFWGAYSISKAALDALVKTYAAECENSSVRVNAINPGPLRTAMRAQAMPGEEASTLAHPSEISDTLVMMGSIACDRNGEMYDFPSRTWAGKAV